MGVCTFLLVYHPGLPAVVVGVYIAGHRQLLDIGEPPTPPPGPCRTPICTLIKKLDWACVP